MDVLVVCTGNLCRSPMIATLLGAAAPSLTVRSAGTAAPLLRPWHPLAVQALAEVGHDVSGRAHRLRRADVAAAQLVLTAEGAHRAIAVRLDPSAEDRVFTLLEAARLLRLAPAAAGIGAEALAAHLAAALRAHPGEHADDLADPLFGDLKHFRHTREEIEAALAEIVPPLAGGPA
jgi:protein-tyrosine phosphatase